MRKLSFLMVICVVCSMVFASCGKKDDAEVDLATEIVGAWTLTNIIDADGNSYTLEEYCAANGVDSEGLELTYTFAADGTVVGDIAGIGVEGTYEIVSDTTVNMTFETGILSAEYSDGELVSTDAASGISSVLSK
ncbi:MAG: hypothetical protein WCQ72_02155 [Eubacteriales bacterium]